MSGISTAHVAINDLVDNSNFIAGTKVTLVGVSSVQLDRASTNTVAATASNVSSLVQQHHIRQHRQQRVF